MSEAVLEERLPEIEKLSGRLVKDAKPGTAGERETRLADGKADQEFFGQKPNRSAWPFFM